MAFEKTRWIREAGQVDLPITLLRFGRGVRRMNRRDPASGVLGMLACLCVLLARMEDEGSEKCTARFFANSSDCWEGSMARGFFLFSNGAPSRAKRHFRILHPPFASVSIHTSIPWTPTPDPLVLSFKVVKVSSWDSSGNWEKGQSNIFDFLVSISNAV